MSKKIQKPKQSLKTPSFILLTSSLLAKVAPNLMDKFAAKLFTTPIKHKIPKRELRMNTESIQTKLFIPKIKKEIVVYQYGNSNKKVLLVHGWSGRGTQLFKIADSLLAHGYSTISFDAPAHGKSAGSTTMMLDFIESIIEIDKQFGPFEAAVGHSLGGMSVANAIARHLKVNSAVLIGSGNVVQDILDDFISKLQINPIYSQRLCEYFERKLNRKMDDYSAFRAAQKITIPIVVIHDNDDLEVPVKASINIKKHLQNGTLLLTDGLGHRKILGNEFVIDTLVKFINDNQPIN